MIILNPNYKNNNNLYLSYLKAVCSLSKLFSESKIPFLYYRIAENVFCKAFSAENLSRDDLAYDARKGNLGIGLKTFIDKGINSEKVAEFNAFSNQLRNSRGENLAIKLSELRNERILFANRTYGIDSVRITKVDNENFKIDFTKLDGYETFINNEL